MKPGTTFTYIVKAVDDAGIESLGSTPLVVQTHNVPDCKSYSGTIAHHMDQDRTYMEERCRHFWCWIWPWPKTTRYYAKGSGDDLGEDNSIRVILYTKDDENFSTSACQGP